MAGEGQILKTAREEKNWSLTDTEEFTKISVRYIKALEEEDYGILPGTTYTKGYLRTYAKHLGLNPDEIIKLFKSSMIPEETILEPPQKIRQFHPVWVRPAFIGSLAIVAVVMIISVASLSHYERNKGNSPYVPPALPSAPKVEAAASAQGKSSNEAVVPSQGKQSIDKAASSPVGTNDQAAPASSANSAKGGGVDTQDGLTAKLVFTQPCWIKVKVDGQPPFQGTFQPGTSKEVKGTSKIELVSVGNAGGLSVILNGKEYPNLGTDGQVVRNVILTKTP